MFEKKLAWRYIKAQKRHSILTVCSIAIALALMTMLFALFSTAIGCLRDIAYNYGDDHITIYQITKEQAETVAELTKDDAECTITEYPQEWKGYYYVGILFNDYIGDREVYIDDLLSKAGIQKGVNYVDPDEEWGGANWSYNELLMTIDMVDLTARLKLMRIFAIFYLFVVFFIIALRLVIDTAFEVSSKERERQFGVLQSIGATPRQTARIITVEGLMLSVIGIPIGVVSGIGLGYVAYRAVISSGIAEAYFTAEEAAKILHFHVSPLITLIGAATGLIWVLLSAYGTGMRIVRMSPVQAISGRKNTVKKVKKRSLFGAIFGWTGKLASRNNMRQKKRYIITVLSLTISITLFAMTSMVMEFVRATFQESLETEYDQTEDFGFACQTDEGFALDYKGQVKLLTESGYFSDIYLNKWVNARYMAGSDTDDEEPVEREWIDINYYDKNKYLDIFDGEPPVSYEELTEQNGYIILRNSYFNDRWQGLFPENGTVSLSTQKITHYSEEEYAELTPEQQEYAMEMENVVGDRYYLKIEQNPYDFNIMGATDAEDLDMYLNIYLIGSFDSYEKSEYQKYEPKVDYVNLYCNLAEGASYYDMLSFVSEHERDGAYVAVDMYAHRQQLSATISAIKIILAFLIIMIALIAAVNMVNILSTGVLNRRGELAALQCVGMTRRQLYKMTVVECLQYALGSGLVSAIFSESLVFGTRQLLTVAEMLEKYGHFATYSAPLLRIGIAVAVAFVIALLASLIPLCSMQKTSLVEQIRSVE